ncbi:MAG TPA: ATP-binding protein [Tepidisphaeraceae bacterium]|jgi:signal transduction histidine kinase|nr:ATP-binding protein [Tepidisphaeraceae bacterium]
MTPFAWGMLAGWVSGLIVLAVVGYVAYRRILTLRARALEAQRLAELGTLTSGLAHEIKNPLSTIGLNLQLLKEDLPQDDPNHPRLVARLNSVVREANRLKDILDDFMRYAGRIELELVPTDVGELLEDLVDFFTPQAQLAKVQLRLKKPPTPLMARIDERHLKQTILNLMLNATQAMTEGGELILGARPEGTFVVIDVIDTGPGIAADRVDRLFDAYYSTKPGGTGLGLAIAKRIIEAHHGTITLQSQLGKGTDFTIRLPLEK